MNDKIKNYILSHWNQYNMVDSREEMIEVLNILEAHDENLDTLHDIVMGNTDMFCGIWITSNPQTDREVKNIMYEYNMFFKTNEELMVTISDDADVSGLTVEEFLEYEDIRETSDGLVRVLHY